MARNDPVLERGLRTTDRIRPAVEIMELENVARDAKSSDLPHYSVVWARHARRWQPVEVLLTVLRLVSRKFSMDGLGGDARRGRYDRIEKNPNSRELGGCGYGARRAGAALISPSSTFSVCRTSSNEG